MHTYLLTLVPAATGRMMLLLLQVAKRAFANVLHDSRTHPYPQQSSRCLLSSRDHTFQFSRDDIFSYPVSSRSHFRRIEHILYYPRACRAEAFRCSIKLA